MGHKTRFTNYMRVGLAGVIGLKYSRRQPKLLNPFKSIIRSPRSDSGFEFLWLSATGSSKLTARLWRGTNGLCRALNQYHLLSHTLQNLATFADSY